ncbi:N-acetyltransferase [uncultured Eubacterium sp.]|uniref:N-acetyltransferase n=1 Tax=uncultured Eubacterium sp. TaxID=165185 RepID=UPI0025E741A9|nr:N-acetyltransferase [uncultured Eubacterium sp.]
MIRKLQKADLNRVADIWLDTNIKAHSFVPAQYWKNNFETVKEMLLQAEVYVYEEGRNIQGFIGLNSEFIEGIFVSSENQSQGIGGLLLNYIKNKKPKVSLYVYQKNTRAISFYQREGFEIRCEALDETTGEKEFVMMWQSK